MALLACAPVPSNSILCGKQSLTEITSLHCVSSASVPRCPFGQQSRDGPVVPRRNRPTRPRPPDRSALRGARRQSLAGATHRRLSESRPVDGRDRGPDRRRPWAGKKLAPLLRNPLKSHDSDERIQGNPRKSKRYFPWISLAFLGTAWFLLVRPGRRLPRPGQVGTARPHGTAPRSGTSGARESTSPGPSNRYFRASLGRSSDLILSLSKDDPARSSGWARWSVLRQVQDESSLGVTL